MLVGIEAVRSGYISRDGQRIHWQEFGAGQDSVLLLPTWSIVHSDFWRHQVGYLSDRCRVITFDGLGNGASDRPIDAHYYGDLKFADDASAIMEECGIDRAAVIGASQGGPWALAMAARHPELVSGVIFIAPNVPLAPEHPEQIEANDLFLDDLDEYVDWMKWNKNCWLQDYPGFLQFFFSKCFTEPSSEPQIENFVAMGLETTPQVLLATEGTDEQNLSDALARQYASAIECPSLVIHGDEDAITPLARGSELARLTGAELVVMSGCGHEPQCRNPVETNRLVGDFLASAFGQ